ncbi:MAG: glycosyltransferase [Alcanivorax sp.]|nr:glycosyltransferase [Alcanivorax sp.]
MSRKVLHVITGLGDGGAEGVLYRLCVHSRFAEHVVVSMIDEGRYGPELRESGIKVYCLGMKRGKLSLIPLFRLFSIIKFEAPDLVQTWMYHADLFGGVIARLSGVKKVFWGVRHSTLNTRVSKITTIMVAKICAFFSIFIPEKIIYCASRAAFEHEAIGYKKNKTVVIHNGIDLDRFYPDHVSRIALRSELDVQEDVFLLGMVSRWGKEKNHLGLLKALEVLGKEYCQFKCLLVGSGMCKSNRPLVKFLEDNNLKDKVILAGQRKDIPAIMNALDLHVLSSYTEGFPNVLAESMACGTPSVSADVGDAKYILGDERMSWPSNDDAALTILLSSMIKKWHEEPKEWQSLGAICRSRVVNNYSLNNMIDHFEENWFGSSR